MTKSQSNTTLILQLADEIIAGRRLGREDDLSLLLSAEIDDLCTGANTIRNILCGNKADLCTIINGRSGSCSENCKFCAQSSHYNTNIEEYPFLDIEEIMADARRNEAAGIHRYSIVTAGRSMKGKDFEKALAAYRHLHENSNMKLCASHGFQTTDDFQKLKDAGVVRYHCNLETSRRYFPSICTSHTYEQKIENIRRAQKVGLEVCSGGIIGMGESWDDRIDMAISLSELGIESIPLNILRPIPGTPFEHLDPVSAEDVLRTIAIFRYINPTAWVRIAAGRGQFPDGGSKLFLSGANSAITGDMLTTTGTNIISDVEMFKELGYKL